MKNNILYDAYNKLIKNFDNVYKIKHEITMDHFKYVIAFDISENYKIEGEYIVIDDEYLLKRMREVGDKYKIRDEWLNYNESEILLSLVIGEEYFLSYNFAGIDMDKILSANKRISVSDWVIKGIIE